MGPQCVHKHYIPPFSGIYVVVIGKKGGKLRRQILQPSQAIDFQSILIYVTNTDSILFFLLNSNFDFKILKIINIDLESSFIHDKK